MRKSIHLALALSGVLAVAVLELPHHEDADDDDEERGEARGADQEPGAPEPVGETRHDIFEPNLPGSAPEFDGARRPARARIFPGSGGSACGP